jgi:hypothetical protein
MSLRILPKALWWKVSPTRPLPSRQPQPNLQPPEHEAESQAKPRRADFLIADWLILEKVVFVHQGSSASLSPERDLPHGYRG